MCCKFYLPFGESREGKLKPSKVIEQLKFFCLEDILAAITKRGMAAPLILRLNHGPQLFFVDYFRTAKADWNFPLDFVTY